MGVSSPVAKDAFAVPLNLLIFLASFLIFGALSVRMGQDANWDLKNYHYYIPYAFFHHRLDFDVAPAAIQTYLNPFLDLPFYFLSKMFEPRAVGFILGGVHGLNFFLLFIICQKVFCRLRSAARYSLSFIMSLLGACGSVGLCELGTTFSDNVTSLFVLASFWLFLQERSKPSLVLGGLVFGLGLGLKWTVLPFAGGTFAAFLITPERFKKRILNALIWGAGLAAGCALTGGYWALYLWYKFGNPIFPRFNGFFRSPYAEFQTYGDLRHMPHNWMQTLFYPFYFATTQSFTAGGKFRDIRLAVVYSLLLILALAAWRTVKRGDRHPLTVPLAAYFVTSYAAWQWLFSIHRYLLPLEMLSPLLIFLLCFRLIRSKTLAATMVTAIFTMIVLTLQPLRFERRAWSHSFFDVKLPAQRIPENAVILIVDRNLPMSYLIPFFPEPVRFLRLNSKKNFLTVVSKTKLADRARRVIETHPGPFYVLTRHKRLPAARRTLALYGLSTGKNRMAVWSKMDSDIELHALSRATPLTAA